MDVTVSTEFLGNVVGYIEKASGVFETSEKQSAEVEAQAKVTLETLKKQGLVVPGASDEELLAKLSSPVEALLALEKTARQVQPPSLGVPDNQIKEANAPGSGVRESDLRFEQALGF